MAHPSTGPSPGHETQDAAATFGPASAFFGLDGQEGGAGRAAAAAAGSLLVDIAPGCAPDDALPGSPNGPYLRPGAGPRLLSVRTDADGLFLARTIDLVLRAQGVRSLVLAPQLPPGVRVALTMLGREQGYAVVETGAIPPLPEQPAPPREATRPDLLGSLRARVEPGAAALVLIDVQNDFCAPDGATGRSGQPMAMIEEAVVRIKDLLAAARDAGLFIVHVRAEYGELYRNVGSPYRFPAQRGREPAVWTASAADLEGDVRFPDGSVEVCLPNSYGGDFVDGVVPLPGEAVVTKHRFGAFTETGLEALLRGRGIRSVVLAGVTTNCCVETTAREAVMRDFYLVVATDAVAVKDHLVDLHHATLESLGLYFGLVRPSADIIGLWREMSKAGPASSSAP